jgi:cytochrome c
VKIAILASLLLICAGVGGYFYISDKNAREKEARVAAAILPNDMLKAANVEEGKERIIGCLACHNVEPTGPPKVGPTLFGIVGRPVASVSGFAYSDALKKHRGKIWNTESLSEWLNDPQAYAPGTLMTFNGMLDPQDRMDLISYLITLK